VKKFGLVVAVSDAL